MPKARSQPVSLPQYESQVIEDFSAGLNTLFNPRVLQPRPNVQQSQPAETPFTQNVDIVSKGAIQTSSGYTLVATLPLTGLNAQAHATIVAGSVTAITVDNGGSGYVNGAPIITITGVNGVGSGATATATVVGGIVTAINITNPGAGYAVAPIVTITSQSGINSLINFEQFPQDTVVQATAIATVVAGGVNSVIVTNGGSGYFLPPTVVFGGPGVGAAATAVLTNGTITAINVTNPGAGYISPPLVTLVSQNTEWQVATIDNVLYSLAPSANNLVLIGAVGARANHYNGVIFRGISGTNVAIFGNDNTNNFPTRWNGTTLTTLTTAPKGGHIMEVYAGSLFIAVGNTLFWSDTYDETTWNAGNAGSKPFTDIITGMFVHDNTAVVYTKRNAYLFQANFLADAVGNQKLNFTVTPFRNNSGNLSPKAVGRIYNDIYAFSSSDGIQRFGADPQFISTNFRVNSLSWKINPSLLPVNYNAQNIYTACSSYFNKQFFFSLPYGNNFFNSQTFVYNYNYDAWTARNGILASQYSIAPNAQNVDELYFGNPIAAEIYKFYPNYDYNGVGYKRQYTTPIFTMGNGMKSKFWQWIDIKGAMYINTTFYVQLIVDGVEKTYSVDMNSLDITSVGGYYGDDYYGSQFYGGPSTSQFKRFGARIPFPVDIKVGRELQISFYNQDPGEPWVIDYLNIVWNSEHQDKIPINYQNAVLTNI
jgi:hypothetical protein